jgi:hypothetical protein
VETGNRAACRFAKNPLTNLELRYSAVISTIEANIRAKPPNRAMAIAISIYVKLVLAESLVALSNVLVLDIRHRLAIESDGGANDRNPAANRWFKMLQCTQCC